MQNFICTGWKRVPLNNRFEMNIIVDLQKNKSSESNQKHCLLRAVGKFIRQI